MKKKFFCFIALAALVVMFTSAGPVLAQSYTVTGASGAVNSPGTYTSSFTGSLDALVDNGSSSPGGGLASPGGVQENYTDNDYVIITGASGSATYSIGELEKVTAPTPEAVNITLSNGVYSVSGAGQSVTGITNIAVDHMGVTTQSNRSYSPSFTISAPGIATTTWGPVASTGIQALPQTNTVYITNGSYTPNPPGGIFNGVSIASLLQSVGVNTSDNNQIVVALGSDNYQVVMSMGEIVYAGSQDIVADGTNENLNQLYYVWDNTGTTIIGTNSSSVDGFARTLMGNEYSHGLYDSNLESLTVIPTAAETPLPASLLLLAPGLGGLGVLRKRLM